MDCSSGHPWCFSTHEMRCRANRTAKRVTVLFLVTRNLHPRQRTGLAFLYALGTRWEKGECTILFSLPPKMQLHCRLTGPLLERESLMLIRHASRRYSREYPTEVLFLRWALCSRLGLDPPIFACSSNLSLLSTLGLAAIRITRRHIFSYRLRFGLENCFDPCVI